MINGGVASLVAIYLILVLYSGNDDKLLQEIKQEVGFLKWVAALLVLMIVYTLAGGKTGEIVKQLTIVALGALLLGKGEAIFKDVASVMTPEKTTESKD